MDEPPILTSNSLIFGLLDVIPPLWRAGNKYASPCDVNQRDHRRSSALNVSTNRQNVRGERSTVLSNLTLRGARASLPVHFSIPANGRSSGSDISGGSDWSEFSMLTRKLMVQTSAWRVRKTPCMSAELIQDVFRSTSGDEQT